MFDDIVFLYVEDDKNSQRLMSLFMDKVLKAKELILFGDSHNFLERLHDLAVMPDVILLDIQVEPLCGFEMIRLLRQSPMYQDKKVIALTASVMNHEVKKLRTAGFDGTISKPLAMPVFPELMKRVVKGEPVWHMA